MKKLVLLLTTVMLFTAACNDGSSPAPDPVPVPSSTVPDNTVVLSTRTDVTYGLHIVEGDGHAVYAYTQDADSETSTCTGSCLASWRPVLALDNVVTNGLDDGLIGVNGDGQILYNGHLLYYYISDLPNEVTGQGVSGFFLLDQTGSLVPVR